MTVAMVMTSAIETAVMALALFTLTVHTIQYFSYLGPASDICICWKRSGTPSHLLRKWWCHTHKLMRVMKATFLKRELSPPPHSQRGRD